MIPSSRDIFDAMEEDNQMELESQQQHAKQVEDQWQNLKDLFLEECKLLNKSPSIQVELADAPDREDVFWIINARRDRNKPLLRFGLRRDVPAIICLDEWNNRPKQSFKFVFHGVDVMLTGVTGVLPLPEFVHTRMQGILSGLKG